MARGGRWKLAFGLSITHCRDQPRRKQHALLPQIGLILDPTNPRLKSHKIGGQPRTLNGGGFTGKDNDTVLLQADDDATQFWIPSHVSLEGR